MTSAQGHATRGSVKIPSGPRTRSGKVAITGNGGIIFRVRCTVKG